MYVARYVKWLYVKPVSGDPLVVVVEWLQMKLRHLFVSGLNEITIILPFAIKYSICRVHQERVDTVVPFD